jgi:hypothetical protein
MDGLQLSASVEIAHIDGACTLMAPMAPTRRPPKAAPSVAVGAASRAKSKISLWEHEAPRKVILPVTSAQSSRSLWKISLVGATAGIVYGLGGMCRWFGASLWIGPVACLHSDGTGLCLR